MRKTYKREVAVGLLTFLVGAAVYALIPEDTALIEARAALVGTLAGPILAFAAAAFGMEWVSKQTEWGGSAAVPPPPYDEES